MSVQEYQNGFQQFRQLLYQNFNKRADTAMELVDALCSYPEATSTVELSLAPVFRRSHTTLYKALSEVAWEEVPVAELLSDTLPRPKARGFWLFGVDVTSHPRPFARTLSDRSYVYQPNDVAGNKPVTIGHQYSTVVLLPEKESGLTGSWVVPMSTQRVATTADKELVGADQIANLLADEKLPWHNKLVVKVGDTSYSKPAYLYANRQYDNLVTIARARSNRTFYTAYVYPDGECPKHRPRRYGEAFKLPDPTTWHAGVQLSLDQLQRKYVHRQDPRVVQYADAGQEQARAYSDGRLSLHRGAGETLSGRRDARVLSAAVATRGGRAPDSVESTANLCGLRCPRRYRAFLPVQQTETVTHSVSNARDRTGSPLVARGAHRI